MKATVERLKQKWGISSNLDFCAIMLTFSLAGAMISVCRQPIFNTLGVTPSKPLWLKIMVYLPIVFPLYQLSLILFGTLLGQFRFFWDKEKKLGRFLWRALQRLWASPPVR